MVERLRRISFALAILILISASPGSGLFAGAVAAADDEPYTEGQPSETEPQDEPPVVDSFAASPGSIAQGESATLSWDVSGAATVGIDQSIGDVALTGTAPVSPSATTTYTLTAANQSGTATATAEVVVSAAQEQPAEPDYEAVALAVAIPSTIRVLMDDDSVVEMDLDEYVEGVVAAEMYADWPIEALKAQAVAARTFALNNSHHDHLNVDVCTSREPYIHCQAWNPPPYAASIEEAVTATHNVVITYDGEIITEALFFSHCDGHTRNIEDYEDWGYQPYLRSVACQCASTHGWSDYGADAHGVGMCQYGAEVMAEQGHSYVDILEHYYTGVEIVTASTSGPDDGEGWVNPYLVDTFIDEQGRQIDKITVPGRPPEVKAAVAALPERRVAGVTSLLSNVPALDWSYGCSATSAAMMFGYYDQVARGYTNMYAGPTNGGVFPLPTDETIWGETSWPGVICMECPLSATRAGIDGRPPGTKGHVDDYWVGYLDPGPDPYVGSWTEHTHADCTADFMGTSQSKYSNPDGSTAFYYRTDGAKTYDAEIVGWTEPTMRGGCHGMHLFAESRAYTVVENYNQYIIEHGRTYGFTFAEYKAEIDAGRPVLIQVSGHTMLGYGYNDTSNLVYLHDTWDYSNHTMTWGGDYEGLQHLGVTVIELEPAAPPTEPPPPPTLVSPTNGATVSGTSVAFEWNPSAGATKYFLKIHQGGSSGPVFDSAWLGNVTSHTVSGFPNDGTTYFWRVNAGNDAGYAPVPESIANGRTFINELAPPAAPTLISPDDGATVPGSSITFEWNPPAGATKYFLKIHQGSSSGPVFDSAWLGNVTSHTVSGFPREGTTYFWRVNAGNDAGYAPVPDSIANGRTFTSEGGQPLAPTLLSPDDGATVPSSSISFEWNPSAGATKYFLKIHQGSSSGPVFDSAWLGNVTSHTVSGFPNDGTTYFWRVNAGNDAGYAPVPESIANGRTFTSAE